MSEDIKVTSAAPAEELSNEERRKRYAQLRERLGRSKLEVKGEPGVHYFWADANDQAELVRLDYVGYQIVREKDPKHPKVQAAGLKEDGTYVIGDVILMQCTEELYQMIVQDNQERSDAAVLGATEGFKSEALKKGIPVFDVPIPKKGR